MKARGPFRPVPSWATAIRWTVRKLRYGRIKLAARRKIRVGSHVVFATGCKLLVPDFAHFGNSVSIGRNFYLEQNLIVGDEVLISGNVSIVGNDHPFDDPSFSVFSSPRAAPCTVTIEGDNLIGFGTTIVGGVTIGKGCIVGARSVVTRDLPPYTVCTGSPAKPIRKRFAS
jgi:acetyltransferase-like isoleucine patch superfamily enzyme